LFISLETKVNTIKRTSIPGNGIIAAMDGISQKRAQTANLNSNYYTGIVFVAVAGLVAIALLKTPEQQVEAQSPISDTNNNHITELNVKERLDKLEDLFNQGVLTQDECAQKRSEIINSLNI
jgi:hypothetical protein